MKTSVIFRTAAVVFAAVVVWAVAASAEVQVFDVDPAHSSTNFKVRHLGIGYVTGGFTDISGTVSLDAKKVSASSVDITVKTASVNTNEPKRDEHLRSADFFDVVKFPEMTFKSTKVEKLKDGSFRVSGNFTLHGVSKKIVVRAEKVGEGKDPKGNVRAAFESGMKIKRSDYGMTKMIPAAGDEVEITLYFECILKK